MSCPLCDALGGTLLWQDSFCRVVLADEPDYPGFLRVILNAHTREMSDLSAVEQQALMSVVFAAETALREVMQPDKINLASLGNVVPHLHWHVIPRFEDDPHFPNPVWGVRLRDTPHATSPNLWSGGPLRSTRKGQAVVLKTLKRQEPRSTRKE